MIMMMIMIIITTIIIIINSDIGSSCSDTLKPFEVCCVLKDMYGVTI